MADVSGRCCPTDEESGRFAPFSPTFPPEKGKKKVWHSAHWSSIKVERFEYLVSVHSLR